MTKEPVIESKVDYDDRRKTLTHQTKEIREAEIEGEIIGEVSMETKGVYNEKGIRKIVKDLNAKIVSLEKTIKDLKNAKEKIEKITNLVELKKFQMMLGQLKTLEMKEKQEQQLVGAEAELKKTKKDVGEIKNSIGTRLKF